MRRTTVCRRVGNRAIAFGLAGVVAGCSGTTSPAHPSAVSVETTRAADQTSLRPPSTDIPQAAGGVLTPDDLTSRGWTCFEPVVVPPMIICSHPNQGRPAAGNPPPADRPATYNLFRFDKTTGAFIGPVHLIRTDLYNGQMCESTGQPYVLIPIIGYYECAHPGGR